MSAIANIDVYDGAATPAPHTLVPVSVTRENGMTSAEWRAQTAGVPYDAQIYCKMTLQKLRSGVYKTTVETGVPVQEVVTGNNSAGYSAPPKVAYVDRFVVTGYFHPRSTIASRRLARQLATNLLLGRSDSVAVITAAPAAEIIDQLIAPT